MQRQAKRKAGTQNGAKAKENEMPARKTMQSKRKQVQARKTMQSKQKQMWARKTMHASENREAMNAVLCSDGLILRI